MNKKPIPTVIIAIIKDNKVLLVRHGEKAQHLKGVCGLPGGRIEPKERPADAAIRETKEETGLTIDKKNLKKLPSKYYAEIERNDGRKKIFGAFAFFASKFDGKLVSSEETTPLWTEIKNMSKMELLPNHKKIIEEALSVLEADKCK